jgi:hypothetical protein
MADLYAGRVDHLIADSHHLEQMTVDGAALVYGAFVFKAVVVPPLKLLPLAVAEKILEFARAGGSVYALGALPDASAENGVGDPAMTRLMTALRQASAFVAVPNGLAPLLATDAPELAPCVTFESGAFPLIASRREIDGRYFFWLANNTDRRHEFVLRVNASGQASVWNCETGETVPVPCETISGGSRVALALEPYEAYWLVLDPSRAPQQGQRADWETLPSRPFAPLCGQVLPKHGGDGIDGSPDGAGDLPGATGGLVRTQPLLALDGPWYVKVDPSDQPALAQHRLAAPDWLLTGADRPLESWLNWDLRQFTGFVDYTRRFDLKEADGSAVLDLGRVKYMAEVWINGKHAGARLWPPFRFAVGRWLRPGENALRVRVGNLLVNAITQYENFNWKWHRPPTGEMLDAGLFGPVTVLRPAGERSTSNVQRSTFKAGQSGRE